MYSRQAIKIKPLTQALEVRVQIILKIIRTSRRAIYDCVINVEIFRSCWCKEADHLQKLGREVDQEHFLGGHQQGLALKMKYGWTEQ